MIERYILPQMRFIWSEGNKFQTWLKVELLVCEAQAKLGFIPPKALKTIKNKARFDIQRINQIEAEVHHEVMAFLTNLAENIGEPARFVHLGMTSSDLLDTALALLMRQAGEIILKDLNELANLLKKLSLKHKNTIMIGRTHGMHAEPITFGLKLLLWYYEIKRQIKRMQFAIETISYGKISGVVGTYAHINPKVERYVCQKLKLKPVLLANQIIQRDRHSEYLLILALIATSLEKFATEIRHLQRTEVGEVAEPFYERQKGSSAMPHKRNPILCERICGLARVIRTNAFASLENISLWHERDISHSSVERIIIPDSTSLLDYILVKMRQILEGLEVHPERMQKNMQLTYGTIFSQKILLALTKKGMSRESAYRLVQNLARQSLKQGKDFQELILENKEIRKYLRQKEIVSYFEPKSYLKEIETIYRRQTPDAER
ncbi:MAG: adenylosuccinate lyase [Candidatus Edwardsbacteria bacterium]